MDNYKGSEIGVVVECENGYVVSTASYGECRAYDNDGKEIERWRGGGSHHENFLAAVKSRKPEDLNAPALEGHLSSALCHTGQVSHQLGEPRTAKEILASVDKNDRLRDAVERMMAHLKANEVNVDEPVVTAGVVAGNGSANRAVYEQSNCQGHGPPRRPQTVRHSRNRVITNPVSRKGAKPQRAIH